MDFLQAVEVGLALVLQRAADDGLVGGVDVLHGLSWVVICAVETRAGSALLLGVIGFSGAVLLR